MHISFDIDGVLADFNGEVCRRIRETYNIDVPQTPHALAWGWSSWISELTDEMEREVLAPFWKEILPWHNINRYYDVSTDRINALANTHAISFITTRPQFTQAVTRDWLRDEGIWHHANVYIADSNHKGVTARFLGVHVHIDDKGEEVINCLDNGVVGVLLLRPYNKGYEQLVISKGGLVVETVDEFIDYLMQKHVAQEDLIDSGPSFEPIYMADQSKGTVDDQGQPQADAGTIPTEPTGEAAAS